MPEQTHIKVETENGDVLRHKERQERFLRLLMPVYERLARFARALVNDREDARDLISDTVLAALEQLDDIREDKAFLSYVFTIARRLAKRYRTRAKLFGEYDEEAAEQIHDTQASPETSLDVRFLYEALAKLPSKQRDAVILFEISGFSLEEIRDIQGGSLSGVKSRVARGRQRLAKLLGADDYATSESLEQPKYYSDEAAGRTDQLSLIIARKTNA